MRIVTYLVLYNILRCTSTSAMHAFILWAGPPLMVRPMSCLMDTGGHTPTTSLAISRIITYPPLGRPDFNSNGHLAGGWGHGDGHLREVDAVPACRLGAADTNITPHSVGKGLAPVSPQHGHPQDMPMRLV